MFILTEQIHSWQELQQRTYQIFSEMDYDTEISKVIPLAGRGKKEIDVYVTDNAASENQIYLVECKHWNSSVPQEVVHSFKTVMEEVGADTGFIISKNGFQSGAYEASRFTNIKLMTFAELQEAYGKEWMRKQWNKLEAQVARLRIIHHLHFDQFNTLPLHNNMFFHTEEQSRELSRFHRWVSNLLCDSRLPEIVSFSKPEIVTICNDPYDPEKQLEKLFEFPSPREYFSVMTAAAKACADAFESSRKNYVDEFDKLDDERQTEFMNASLRRSLEELPLRVLKQHITSEEFERLLILIRTSGSL